MVVEFQNETNQLTDGLSHQKNKTRISPIHEFKVLQNVYPFKMKNQDLNVFLK